VNAPWLKYRSAVAEPWHDGPAEFCNWVGAPEPSHDELPPLPDDDEHARWLRGEISFAAPVQRIDRPDVATAIEDLADEGRRPGKIARILGLRRHEVVAILRRSGR
jgi:hypothetical protein